MMLADGGGFICGGGMEAPSEVIRILVSLRECCAGALESPGDCTCWEPQYDTPQAPPQTDVPPETRAKACDDCAYRPGSPERAGDERFSASEPGKLADLAGGGGVFYCHDGMRKPTSWKHVTLGIVVPCDGDFYDPPMRRSGNEMIPYRANGAPGLKCAGWDAMRRALLEEAPVNA